jgi:hypothetical protein
LVDPVAVIAQCPYTGGPVKTPLNASFIKTALLAIADPVKQALRMGPIYIPAGADPGTVGGLTSPGSKDGLLSLAAEER